MAEQKLHCEVISVVPFIKDSVAKQYMTALEHP